MKNLIDRVGDIKYLINAFSESNRKTDIEIEVVYLRKPLYENELDFFGSVQTEILSDEEKIREQLKDKVNSSQLMSFDKVDYAINVTGVLYSKFLQGLIQSTA